MHALLPSLLPAPAKQTHLADEELSGLLVLADLAEGDGSRAVPMRLLDSTCGRGALPGSLGGELLTGSLASGRFAGGLLGTGHFSRCMSVQERVDVVFYCIEADSSSAVDPLDA